MMTMLIFAAIFAAFFLSSFPVLAADGVPVLDVKQTCQGAEVAAVNPGQTQDACLQSEESARDQLRKGWSNYPAADRIECGRMVKIGPPSYVDLLTCLEIRRDARLPQTETTGAASNLRQRQPTPDSVLRGGQP